MSFGSTIAESNGLPALTSPQERACDAICAGPEDLPGVLPPGPDFVPTYVAAQYIRAIELQLRPLIAACKKPFRKVLLHVLLCQLYQYVPGTITSAMDVLGELHVGCYTAFRTICKSDLDLVWVAEQLKNCRVKLDPAIKSLLEAGFVIDYNFSVRLPGLIAEMQKMIPEMSAADCEEKLRSYMAEFL